GHEMTLVGTDRAAEGVVIVERRAETERQNGGLSKASGDHASMCAGGGLCVAAGEAGCIFGEVFGNNNGEVGRGNEEGLITEEAGDSIQRHRSAVTGKFGKI